MLTTMLNPVVGNVQWKEGGYWLSVTIDPENSSFARYGKLHTKIGQDETGCYVWPDQTIHDLNPHFLALYTFEAADDKQAERIADGLCKTSKTQGMPVSYGQVWGPWCWYTSDTNYRVNTLSRRY